MNTVDFDWNGQTLHLLLNGAALFDIFDRYGSDTEILTLIDGSDKKSYLNTCWLLYKLAEQGELARRFLGHDHERYPTAERLAASLMPLEVPKARRAITQAVKLGFGMLYPEDTESEFVDLGLLELQKKTGSRRTWSSIFRRLRSFFTCLLRKRRR